MMKKLINRPEAAVDEMLEGMVALNPCVVRLAHLNVLVRSDFAAMRDRQVALISGGGSGHEPAHGGYIGEGMLSAAVAGEIFTSPTVDAIFAAIKAVAGEPGVLLIVKNYTGDRLNFGLAAEMARAEGIAVRMVIVADDVALLDKHKDVEQQSAGARGLAGTVLIHKIAGAVAAEGKSLAEVSAAAAAAAGSMGTMGLALSAGTSPTLGEPSFVLGEREIELGLGIHGEPGVRRTMLASADLLTDTLVESILSAREIRAGERIVALVNNLGATTTMEMDIVARHAFSTLASRGLQVERIYSGSLLTSLDMAGVSLTLLCVDDERLRLLDAATSAPAWPNFPRQRPTPVLDRVQGWSAPVAHATEARMPPQSGRGKLVEEAIKAACLALLETEPRLTEMDRVVGDGDLGISLARGAKALQDALPGYPLDDLPATLKAIGYTLQAALGGASGPLYGVLFIRGGSALEGRDLSDTQQWADALTEACNAMSELGGAKMGDRTMLDALIPFAEALKREAAEGRSAKEILEAAVAAAVRGAEQTAHMLPRRGRSSYLGERALGHGDPGAIAVSIWVRAIVSSLSV
jgi:triose/dihydroxyacetone kinase / FAD-AMP lyase (cyclizing)